MSEEITTRGSNPVARIRNFLADVNVKERLEDILGKRAGAFGNSIINVVRGSNALQKCSPESIMSASMIAATMNLPIDPALGQAAIVPYGGKAQFQIMYKGVTQLCIRSGQYKTIHCAEVYADELESHNPITGRVTFKDPKTYKLRYESKEKNIVGHYAYFELISGFEKWDYMTSAEVLAHAKKYSKAYQYDLRDNKRTSKWSTDPTPMGNKTILLRLLTKYGIMSIEMQDALLADHAGFETSQAEAEERINGEAGSKPIDAEFEDQEEQGEPADDDWMQG